MTALSCATVDIEMMTKNTFVFFGSKVTPIFFEEVLSVAIGFEVLQKRTRI
jgi:hypothetical protein